MSRLDELIQQYCPDGVEYVRFVDYANVLYGCPFDAAQFTNDSSYIPLIRIRDVLSGKAGTYYKGEYSHDYIIKKGDILVGMDGNFNLGIWDDIDGLLCQRVCKLYTKDETRLLNGFIRHYMKPVFRQIEESTPGGSVKHLSAKAINSIHIPLPPLPVQEEIVRVLDAFTELQAELQAELQKRKQQYNYYLDNLLNFKNINRGGYQAEVRWMKMSEVFEIRNGYTPSKAKKEFWEGGTIPWFRMEDIRQNGRILSDSILHITPKGVKGKGLFKANSFILATTATIGEHALIIADSLANQRFTNLSIRKSLENELSVKYVYYYFFVIDEWCKANTNVSNFASVDMSKFYNLLIPIPSIAEQQRIVAILDRFDTLTTDLTQGLPAEIEKRRQQYEYYRDKLLTFKRKGA